MTTAGSGRYHIILQNFETCQFISVWTEGINQLGLVH